MATCLQHNGYCDVEKEQYTWIDINWPIIIQVYDEVRGGRTISMLDDVLQTKQSSRGSLKKEKINRFNFKTFVSFTPEIKSRKYEV